MKSSPTPAPADSMETSDYPKEGSLLTACTSKGQVSFYTHLMLPMKNGMKSMTVKIYPGTQVNTIPLSRYQKIFPHKTSASRYPKQGSLVPMYHTWISHNGKLQPFLGHFITDVNHATQPRLYLTYFYIFKDATTPQILLSYATSEHLGILKFKVPNLTAQSLIGTITIPN